MHITDTFYEMNILGDLNVNEPQDMHYIVFYQSHYQIEGFNLVLFSGVSFSYRIFYLYNLVCINQYDLTFYWHLFPV